MSKKAAPVVEAIVRRTRDCWELIVEVCPFCGKRHQHGGGDPALPLKLGSPGGSVAHCNVDGQVSIQGYILVRKGRELPSTWEPPGPGFEN
jgi:hypothetical protein